KAIDGNVVSTGLSGLAPRPTAPVQALLTRTLTADEVNRFTAAYLKTPQDPAKFWKQIAADPTFAARAGQLKLTVQVAGLTDNHVPLVTAVLNRSDIKEASDLARLTNDQWKTLIQAPGVGIPDTVAGATPDEKVRNYIGQILE